jgi:FKBP-type peptidyl-prolyl cis-trans isomerase (trigger factor)
MRNYKGVPRFSTMEMEKRPELQTYSDSIESTLCLWDNSFQNQLKDEAALNVLEMLLDKHYFHDENISAADEEVQKGFEMVSESLAQDLPDISEEILYKVLGVIHFVAQRRTTGRREYFDIIHRHVDFKVGPEMRAQSLLSKIKHTAWG